mmetsp:Transcript_18993/g.31139  ORF Transcript_18993/g.31139 Transcript_18993/m.31139 type:complete len:555 (-) Transcript_18993:421-2085(-)
MIDGYLGLQQISEWEEYRSILESGNLFSAKWVDLRGNHDSFNVPNIYEQSTFCNHSVSGALRGVCDQGKSRHFTYPVTKPYGRYQFIALDMTASPGISVPWNFFGIAIPPVLDFLQKETVASKDFNHTFLLGHFPFSAVSWESYRSSSGQQLNELLTSSSATAYLCGHLHQERMYSRRSGGLLELEVGDLKNNRRFRVFAVDHDLVSMADGTVNTWPLVVITNPKDAMILSDREPWKRMATSSHIRLLAFSPDPILSVIAYIDGQPLKGLEFQQPDHLMPLFVAPWQPSLYAKGLHTITVTVIDGANRTTTAQHSFSLDGIIFPMPLSLGHFLQISDWNRWLGTVFHIVHALVLGMFLLGSEMTRLFVSFFPGAPLHARPNTPSYNMAWPSIFSLFGDIPLVQWLPLFLYWAYLPFGPLQITPSLSENLSGSIYADGFWFGDGKGSGLYTTDGKRLPFSNAALFLFPLVLWCAMGVQYRRWRQAGLRQDSWHFQARPLMFIPMLLGVMNMCISLPRGYGWSETVFSPALAGFVVMAVWVVLMDPRASGGKEKSS